MPKFSIVIPTLGEEKRPSLKSVMEAVSDADEMIVEVDDKRIECVELTNRGIKKATGDIIIVINDRQKFLSNWKEETLKAFSKINNSGLVNYAANTATAAAVSRDYLEGQLGGYYYWPGYIHYYGDAELGEVARRERKYIEREHLIDLLPRPSTDNRGINGKTPIEWDMKMFYAREKLGFPFKFEFDAKEREKYLGYYLHD